MRKLNAVLNDYPSETKSVISFMPEDFDRVDSVWHRENDPHLVRLQEVESFKGYTRWADVTPEHFRLLIMRIMRVMANLSEEERADNSRAEVNAMTFLILAYVRCLELRTGSIIESFKVNVISPMNISFEFLAEVEVAFDPPKPADTGEFSIIVDNSDDQG